MPMGNATKYQGLRRCGSRGDNAEVTERSRRPIDPLILIRLDLAMKELTITQAELARVSGVSQTLISRYLSAQRDITVGNLVRLARALGVRIGWLVDGEQPQMARIAQADPDPPTAPARLSAHK